ncbi:GtrA family protein [Luteibacter sp. PPL201]|uniref:GtrA family protein n=1 Tax=Luteibacter sahnii TaxID=3021977 RepID=A0ABT6B9R6_9GAMM|nr:GtrA family protein [Luteibacter sp. PPL193]MDY1546819.1 GtrA family protein [Luteibacter sp. PPL193]
MTRRELIIRYAIFAAIAILINLGSQALAVSVYHGPFAIPLSVIFGTGTGLVAKYVLDKNWIFYHQAANRSHQAKTFVLYTVMGLATTGIFWITEALFHAAFDAPAMRYVGGLIGLVAGYLVKYQLDLRHVFVDARAT